MRTERGLPRLFLLLLLALLALAGWQWRGAAPVSADLMALVPGDHSDALVHAAEQRMQAPLNRELLVLVGHPEQGQAIALARQLGEQWQASGLFEQVQWSLQADLPTVRQQLLQGRLAMLASADRAQLLGQPEAFIQQRLQALFDPFTGFSLVPSQDDWLGLSQRIQNSQPQHANVQLDLNSGALLAHAEGNTWVLLRARTAGNAFDLHLPERIAARVAEAREQSSRAGGQLLAASGLLYAANGQQQARNEITWVGGGATLGIIALLLVAFRRARVLLALLPVAVGMLAGTTLCVAVFGQVHVMTLVLGASLIGVAVDYPLHYLSKCWSLRPWQAWPALRATLPGLALSLATSCIGYLALAFTPFPALTQIALFSAGGLCGAWLTATCLLPALFKAGAPRPAAWPLALAERLVSLRLALLARVNSYWLLAGLLLVCAGGVYQLQVRNDLRQWIDSSPALLAQAKAVARITGYQPTSQFFLVQGRDEGELLARQQALAERLQPLVAAHQLQGFMALSQLVSAPAEQAALREGLAQLPAHWQPLVAAGVPEAALRAELAQLQQLPVLSIEQALAGPLGEPWRLLWLGPNAHGVAGAVSLQGLADATLLAHAADGLPGVQWVDRLGALNHTFAATQVSAAELKLLSCGLILLLLIAPFGLGGAAKLVALPLLAALCSLAGLGWLGQPLTLFSVFGLLLATAISVDYAILMREQVGGTATSLLGTLLAAITTWLSFGLLMVSSTPAVSNFGLAVSLGLVFSFLLAPWAAKPNPAKEASR
ncbi:MMPL family transporter [Pseudomonas sp. NPDC007930]|uniref:MMPL family transporter n=1 Tax=Pseudomonas sp. NPDC007930 TaxID=3364417 RepID=UPI0036E35DB6